MEYFKNVESRVRRTSTGITELPDGYLSNSVVNVPVNESAKPTNSVLAKAAKQKEEMAKKAKDTRRVINKKFNDTRLEADAKRAIFSKKFGEMNGKGKKTVFKRLLTEMYIESLYLDEDFILENFNTIAGIVENFIEENGGYSLLENAYIQTKSPLLKKMIDICEETTKRVTARVYKVAEKDQNVDLLNFELDSEEKEKFDYDKRDLGLEEISNIVKEKVLTVVKDEKAREQKHEELMEDIENELSENPDVVDEKSIKENLNRIFAQSSPTEEGTLFNALLRSTYKSVIEGTAPLFTNDFSTVEENFLVDDIDFEDADLDEDISDFPCEEESLEDEEIFEVFDSNAALVAESLNSDNEDSSEKLEGALSDMKNKIKDVAKSVKTGKRAKTVKKDIRKIQKSTEELEETCKKKTSEGCKKKAIESFVDDLDDVVEYLDNVIDVHESAMVEVNEGMRQTKGDKTFIQPLVKLNDISLPDVKFMYKIKAVKKEVSKLSKSSKNKNVAKNVTKIIEKNISNAKAMITKLEQSTNKSKDKKINALNNFKSELQNKLQIVKESIDHLEESVFVEELEIVDEGVKEVLQNAKSVIANITGVNVYKSSGEIFDACKALIKANKAVESNPTKSNIDEAIKMTDMLIRKNKEAINVYNKQILATDSTKKKIENQYRESIKKLELEKKKLQALKSTVKENYEIEFEEEEFIEESADGSVDMDQMLAQTIANYTLMEMCYTIKLANYRPMDIMKMTHNLLNK